VNSISSNVKSLASTRRCLDLGGLITAAVAAAYKPHKMGNAGVRRAH